MQLTVRDGTSKAEASSSVVHIWKPAREKGHFTTPLTDGIGLDHDDQCPRVYQEERQLS